MLKEDKFQQHIHVFRGVAIMLIVGAHTISALNWSDNQLTMRIIDALCNESSIFFFFIAGYLFQHLSGRFRYKTYLEQKLKTVITPYLLLSIPALIIFTQFVDRVGMWPWFYDQPLWKQVVLFLLTGKHLAPLWFVPTITLFYLIAPLLLAIDRKRPQLYWLIIPCWFLSMYLGRGGPYGPIEKAIYLFPVYLLGMAFSHYRQQAEMWVAKFWLPLLIVTLMGMVGHALEWPMPPSYLMIMKAPMALLLTVALLRWHGVFRHRLDYIAHVSFGIFFIHAYFISAIKVFTVYLITGHVYAGRDGDVLPGNLLFFIAYAAAVLALSLLTIWAAQKLTGKNSRMLVGA
ncbi:acyltransferase [Rhodoferax sp. U2-2l]|uniref:acyltransferase family protein n=1 Tax=Rhodoferax sp. U2-2l TaxID=2884000 RepID=UPI001D0B2F7C|nr:acyltransferase [Rhodoferax sp. U2-2l]MCB8747176.1 acyltransferase [Rhodoferax sp. U2-2l]